MYEIRNIELSYKIELFKLTKRFPNSPEFSIIQYFFEEYENDLRKNLKKMGIGVFVSFKKQRQIIRGKKKTRTAIANADQLSFATGRLLELV